MSKMSVLNEKNQQVSEKQMFFSCLLILIKKGRLLQLKFGVNIYLWAR